MHFRKITGAAVWIIDWNRAWEQRERMVKGCRAAGAAGRERSQEIFMTENQQDLVPLVMGQERGEGSKMLPRCLQLSWGNRSAFGGGGEDLVWRQGCH